MYRKYSQIFLNNLNFNKNDKFNQPVKGAAIYEAGYDEGRACVWMTVLKDDNCPNDMYYIVQRCRNIIAAQIAAEKWQTKENKAVLKSTTIKP